MKFFAVVALSLGFFVSFGSAEARGIDERVHLCNADSEAKNLGPGVRYRLHVVAGVHVTLSRFHDGRWLRAVADEAGPQNLYVVMPGLEGGDLWPNIRRGTISDVGQDGKVSVSYRVSRTEYLEERMNCVLAFVISEPGLFNWMDLLN